MTEQFDVIFVGGGLASGLAAARLRELRPELTSLVLEQNPEASPQTWSFQSLLQSSELQTWLGGWATCSWPAYEVRFPRYSKIVPVAYHSIRSSDFRKKLSERLGASYRTGVRVENLSSHSVQLDDGTVLWGRAVFDARGWPENDGSEAGFQKFIGLTVRTREPHGLTIARLMDNCVEQHEGFRFLYVLPWNDRELLIEDTRYSTSPDLDEAGMHEAIFDYAASQGWTIESIREVEKSALPLPAYGALRPKSSHVHNLGVRAGLFHPTTGYSIYEAVQAAEQLALCPKPERMGPHLEAWAAKRWDAFEFHRRLNNMLFFAASESERYKVLERFYQHPEDLIARFYEGQTSRQDKVRILSGRPPLPLRPALYHFMTKKEARHGSA